MEISKTPLKDCVILQPNILKDSRGRFVKIYHQEVFGSLGLDTDFKEEYYSISTKNALRGLHFQLPPYDHVKCVTCLYGKIFDVVVDLRKNSPTYKRSFSIELDAEKGKILYVPKGFAHGFQVLSETAVFLNKTTTIYHAESESGVLWSSCGVKWPNMKPILSDKDKELITLDSFNSPF